MSSRLLTLLSISSPLFLAAPNFISFANSITCSLIQPSDPSDLTGFLLHFTLLSPQSSRNRGVSCVNLIQVSSVLAIFSAVLREEALWEWIDIQFKTWEKCLQNDYSHSLLFNLCRNSENVCIINDFICSISICIYCILLLFTNAMRELDAYGIKFISCISANTAKTSLSWSLIYMCGYRNKYYY